MQNRIYDYRYEFRDTERELLEREEREERKRYNSFLHFFMIINLCILFVG